jgi:hypothetical protein
MVGTVPTEALVDALAIPFPIVPLHQRPGPVYIYYVISVN